MQIKKLLVAFALGLGLVLALVLTLSTVEGRLPVARADSFTVNVTNDENDGSCSDGDCSLRDAIIEANTNAEADSITLGAGPHVLTIIGTDDDTSASGDLDITGPLIITGLGPGQTIIDASGVISDRVFDIQVGAGTVVISGVTIMNGDVEDNGGGIRSRDADLTLINVEVISNTANSNGGGVYVHQGSATLSGGQIVSNTAYYGGGVYVYHSSGVFVQADDSIIANNAAVGGGGGMYILNGSATLNGGQVLSNTADYGGGVYVVSSSAFFTQTGNSIIAYNVSDWGGGVSVASGHAVLSGARIVSNTANDQGGGVYVYQGSATLSGVQVISNTASDEGGGFYNNNGTLTLVNTTVSRNVAGDQGGGLYSYNGTSVLSYTTVASNTASWNGGIRRSVGGTVLFKDTIVAHNSPANCGGTLVSNGHNLDSDDTCGFTATGDITGTDPLLGPLVEESGTWVHPLLTGSPVIDAGACIAGITTDQRGVTRPQGDSCDIGAYESLVAPMGVIIGGPTEGGIGQSYAFTVAVSPPTVTLPLMYTWSPMPDSGQGTDVATYSWNAVGDKTISVTVENAAGAAPAPGTHVIEIKYRIYLPLVLNNY